MLAAVLCNKCGLSLMLPVDSLATYRCTGCNRNELIQLSLVGARKLVGPLPGYELVKQIDRRHVHGDPGFCKSCGEK